MRFLMRELIARCFYAMFNGARHKVKQTIIKLCFVATPRGEPGEVLFSVGYGCDTRPLLSTQQLR